MARVAAARPLRGAAWINLRALGGLAWGYVVRGRHSPGIQTEKMENYITYSIFLLR
jgi:hypothetical protein